MRDHEDDLERFESSGDRPLSSPRPKQPWWVAASSLWLSISLTAVWLIAAVAAFFNLPASISFQDSWRLIFPILATLLVILCVPSIIYNVRKHRD
jgi:hypothetical protein